MVLVRQHPEKKIRDCIFHFKDHQEKGLPFKNSKIAFFRFLLKGNASIITEIVDYNKQIAQKAKNHHGWGSLQIKDKYIVCSTCHKEIPLNLSKEEFYQKLQELYILGINY